MRNAVLRPVGTGAAVVACVTCRRRGDGGEGHPAGAALAAALDAVGAGDARYRHIAVQRTACLFACREACAVHLRAPGRIGYVLGRFAPTADAARALLEYARAHAASDHGDVAFDAWPDGVKGHFLVRTPPPGFVVE